MFQESADDCHWTRDVGHSAQCDRRETSRSGSAEPERLEERQFRSLVSDNAWTAGRLQFTRNFIYRFLSRDFFYKVFPPFQALFNNSARLIMDGKCWNFSTLLVHEISFFNVLVKSCGGMISISGSPRFIYRKAASVFLLCVNSNSSRDWY